MSVHASKAAVVGAACNALSRLRAGRLEIAGPFGERLAFEGTASGPVADVYLHDWDALATLLRINQGRASAYLDGRWDSPDLSAVLTLAELNYDVFNAPEAAWWRARLEALRAGRRYANIHARYFLGHDFYNQWLDESLTYSAALFDGDGARTLEQAQTAKFEGILQALRPQAGQTLLDIGCGWGGFAQYAAARYGCRVHAITISRRQALWVQQRILQAGLSDRVTVQAGDFREVTGRYDFVVSIEAYEVMGRPAWASYFATIARCLERCGSAFLQAGVLTEAAFERNRTRPDFVRRHIHSRAELATCRVLEQHARSAGLQVCLTARLANDYARTLECWRRRFNRAWPHLGLDARFHRLWNFYLAYCEAGYRAGRTQLVQAQLEHDR